MVVFRSTLFAIAALGLAAPALADTHAAKAWPKAETPPQAACKHAINTKGTGASGRAIAKPEGRDCDDAAAAKHAINTKGTGAAGRVPPPK